MNRRLILFSLLFLAAACLLAAEPARVAVPEFQNNSEKILTISRSDLAVWMAKELERTHHFKTLDRNKIAGVIKDADWDEDRLSHATEARLQEMSARYVLYGSISEWRIEEAVISRRFSGTRSPQSGSPAVTVVFSVKLVDLTHADPDKDFLVDGNTIGDPEDSKYGDPPYQDNDSRFDQLFEIACKQAFRKAAQQLIKD